VISVVLACGAEKGPASAPALDLYRGPFFRLTRRWAESVTGRGRIFILSALHGLVRADELLAPYDVRMRPSPELVARVRGQVAALGLGGPVYFAGGAAYLAVLLPALPEVVAVSAALPAGRAGRGIGAQRGWYSRNLGRLPT